MHHKNVVVRLRRYRWIRMRLSGDIVLDVATSIASTTAY
jgi:hypothetical protein